MPDPLDPTRPELPTWLTVFKAYWALVASVSIWSLLRAIAGARSLAGLGTPWDRWPTFLQGLRAALILGTVLIVLVGLARMLRPDAKLRPYWDRGLLWLAFLQTTHLLIGMAQFLVTRQLQGNAVALTLRPWLSPFLGLALTLAWRQYWRRSRRVAVTYPAPAAT